MGGSRKLNFHCAQWHLPIFCKNMSVLGILATSPNALPFLRSVFSLSLIFLKLSQGTRIPPQPWIAASRWKSAGKANIPLSNARCQYTSGAGHLFPVCSTEINECQHHARCFGKMHQWTLLLLKELSVPPARVLILALSPSSGLSSRGLQAGSSRVRQLCESLEEFSLGSEVLQTQPLPFSLLLT